MRNPNIHGAHPIELSFSMSIACARQPEDTPKPAEPSAEEVRPPEATTASAPEPEPAPPESAPAAPAASAEPRMRRPPTPPRPRRKLPRSEAEALDIAAVG